MWVNILAVNPDAVTYRFEAANARQWLALISMQTGNLEVADALLTATVAELTKLHQIEPSQRLWQRTLATARSNLAWAMFAQNKFEAAENELRIALSLFELPSDEAAPTDWTRGAAIAYFRAAQVANAKSQTANAETFNSRAIKNLNALLVSDANDRKSAIALAHALLSNNLEADTRRALAALLSASSKQRDAEVLDPLMRAHILLREFDAAHTLQVQLDAMGYQHPNYRAFLALHQPGAVK